MRIMRSASRLSQIATIVAVVIAFATGALAEQVKGAGLANAVVVVAEVIGVDKSDRMVTLLGPHGNVVDIEAGEQVRNFDQIEVGDKVKATYFESIAIYLGEPGTLPKADAEQLAARAAEGDKPGGMVAGSLDVSALVKGVDKEKYELTLELPDGKVVTTEVDPAVKAFDKIKVGDSIHARLTRALAISVEKH
jgi:hypothetical protein